VGYGEVDAPVAVEVTHCDVTAAGDSEGDPGVAASHERARSRQRATTASNS